jgi:hypothetical protein
MKMLASFLLVFCLILFGLNRKSAAKERISFELKPVVCVAPCNLTVELSIPPHSDNRWAIVEIDGIQLLTKSIKLNGSDSPETFLVEFAGLQHGIYEVKAVLYGLEREVSRQKKRLTIGKR